MKRLLLWINRSILRYRLWYFKYKLVRLEREFKSNGQWVMSFNLCHIILNLIPIDLMQSIDNIRAARYSFSCSYPDLDTWLVRLRDCISAYSKSVKYYTDDGTARPGLINAANQLDESVDINLASAIIDSRKVSSIYDLWRKISDELETLYQLDHLTHLKDHDISYLQRVGYPIENTTYEITMILVNLILDIDTR